MPTSDPYETLAPYYDWLHEALTQDLPFWRHLAAETGGPVLELGCGSGRVVLPLARAGLAVTGVDRSPAMLARARARLADETPAVRDRADLHAADLLALALQQRFRLVLVAHNTWSHFDDRQRPVALAVARRHLAPGGRLALDLPNAMRLLDPDRLPDGQPIEQGRFPDAAGDGWIVAHAASELNASWSRYRVTWSFTSVDAGKPPIPPASVTVDYHLIYPHELELELRGAGFRLVSLLGDYDRSPFAADSERMVAIAEPAA